MAKKPVNALKDFANEQAFHALLAIYSSNISKYLEKGSHDNDIALFIRDNVKQLLAQHAKKNNGCAEVLKKTMDRLLEEDSLETKALVMECVTIIGTAETKFKNSDKKYFSDLFNQSFQMLYKADCNKTMTRLTMACINMPAKGGIPSMLEKPIETVLKNADRRHIEQIFLPLYHNVKNTRNSDIGDLAVKVADALLDIIAENEMSTNPNHDKNNETILLISKLIEEGSFSDQEALNALSEKLASVKMALSTINELQDRPSTTPEELINRLDLG